MGIFHDSDIHTKSTQHRNNCDKQKNKVVHRCDTCLINRIMNEDDANNTTIAFFV